MYCQRTQKSSVSICKPESGELSFHSLSSLKTAIQIYVDGITHFLCFLLRRPRPGVALDEHFDGDRKDERTE